MYIDLEKPEGAKKTTEEPTQQYSSAVQMAFSLARYRVIQRSVMVNIADVFLYIMLGMNRVLV